MSTYQQINVATKANVGAPGRLPAQLVGLDDSTLADLSAHLDRAQMADPTLSAFAGMGFVPVADPAPDPRWISVYAFMQRFTQAEREAIEGSEDKAVIDFLTLLREVDPSGPGLSLDDPATQGAVDYMQNLASPPLLAAGRAAQILA